MRLVRLVRFVRLIAAPLLLAAGSAPAAGYELGRATFSGGAIQSADGSYILTGTVGEAVVGSAAGGGFQLGQGFWSSFFFLNATDTPDGTSETVIQYANGLGQSFPNPFHSSTRISFTLAKPSVVRLTVFDVTGRRVATVVDGAMLAGRHSAAWSGRDSAGRTVASGVYFYRLDIGSWSKTKRMLRLH